MTLSKKTSYAILLLIYLSDLPEESSASVGEISDRHKLPERYLWVVASTLARAGLVVAVRGPSGGFRLARKPGSITVSDIVEACDGPIGATDGAGAVSRDRIANAVLADTWRIVTGAWRSALSSLTLEWLRDQYRVRSRRPEFDFQI